MLSNILNICCDKKNDFLGWVTYAIIVVGGLMDQSY